MCGHPIKHFNKLIQSLVVIHSLENVRTKQNIFSKLMSSLIILNQEFEKNICTATIDYRYKF